MHIAHVATSDMSVRLLLFNPLVALRKMGFRVAAVCSPGPWVWGIQGSGQGVFGLAMQREVSPANELRTLGRLMRLFRRERFDVVHSHTPKAGLLAPLAARLACVPNIVHTVHRLLFRDRMPLGRPLSFIAADWATASMSHYCCSRAARPCGSRRASAWADPASSITRATASIPATSTGAGSRSPVGSR